MAGAQRSLALLAFLGVLHGTTGLGVECQQPASSSQTVYDFTVPDIYQNRNVSLSEYRGKVLVITNLASFWGLTPMHYLGYNALKQNFAGKQFEILGFPCDQFNLVCILSYFCFFKLFRSYDFLWGGGDVSLNFSIWSSHELHCRITIFRRLTPSKPFKPITFSV